MRRWLEHAWYGSRAPLLLRPLARMHARLKRDREQPPRATPPVPVIVVGNLVVGGSGKTPVVAALAGAIAATGRRVAILSRGYGGRGQDQPLRVQSGHTAAEVGDEPLELYRRTGVPVWVGRRRAAALESALAAGAQVIISDDGLQHAALPRSFEICVIDGKRGFGNGWLLPAGPLRESTDRLASVDLVLIKQTDGNEAPNLPAGSRFRLEAGALQPVGSDAQAAPPEPPAVIDAVAGIADPERMFAELAARGYTVRRHPLADHQAIDPDWLARLPGPVILTAKDRARLPDTGLRSDLFVLPVTARLPDAAVDRVLAHVREWLP
ncbi:MAG: tetraacyldisaccharide 4'-kinase [Wenzhouxiangellaceae bacterium]|nr:tetraacyldisaccharide 4'-kinase [Wenzhouxiangellaceae bacterium]